jgi:diguanylate cyclase (GGDEF)-like protein
MAWIGLIDPEHSLVKPVATAGDVRDFFDNAPMAILQTKPGGHGLAGRAVRTGRPVVSNDVTNDPQRLMRRELAERGINSLAIIPLVVRDEPIGAFALYAADTGFFDHHEMALLEDLVRDFSLALDHIEKAKRLDYLAYYDPLTGLPNRTLFHERLHMQLEQAAAKNERVALVIMDVERFKTINDAFGRQAGDALLTQVAKRLQQFAMATSWFARVGPDHFAVITTEVATEDAFATRIERRLAENFGQPFAIGERDVRISARVGVAIFPEDGTDSDTLLRNAEAALNKAKMTGERYLFFHRDMTARVAEKVALENKLRQALERDEFVLYYQPKVAIATRCVVGLEALIRWKSPEAGLVSPSEFIPLLEETGLILQVGAWALKRASLDHRAWFEQGLNPPAVSVNVSAIQLRQRDFVRNVRQAINVAVDPAAIELEITESNVMADIQSSIRKLGDVRKIGLDIAIDDFGTGYSSLSYLARLPVQTLKIDRSFIHAMQSDPTARTLVETIIKLAHTLRLKVVAEGVETKAELAVLAALGCDEMQGYLFSKPVPPEKVPAFFGVHRAVS